MVFVIVGVVIVLLAVLALGFAWARAREDRSMGTAASDIRPLPPIDRARQRALEEQENTLLERRVELDTKRGTLLGDDAIVDQFVALEERLRAGEIDEAQFEREKIRLLGG